jgi:hypothetical protein
MVTSRFLFAILLAVLTIGGMTFVRPASSDEIPQLEVTIYFDSMGWTTQQNEWEYTVNAIVRVYVEYKGTDPPAAVGLTTALEETDPLQIARKLLSLRGPWVEFSPSRWTLADMTNGPVQFPDYSFQTRNLKPWPDDALETKVLVAFAATTVSGKPVEEMRTSLNTRTSSRDVIEKSYYYLLNSSPVSGPDLILSQEGSLPSRGHLFSLVLSHGTELEGVRWVGLLASYYVHLLIIISIAVFSLAYADWKTPLPILTGYLAILAAASFQVSQYLSPWSSYVQEAISNSIILVALCGFAGWSTGATLGKRRRDKRKAKQTVTPQTAKDPDIHFNVTQLQSNGEKRTLPSVGLNLENRTGRQVRLRVIADVFLDGKYLGNPSADSGHYTGMRIWNLNANRDAKDGNFTVPMTKVEKGQRLMIRVTVTIVDEQNREHKLLPLGWVYMPENNDWFFEPAV